MHRSEQFFIYHWLFLATDLIRSFSFTEFLCIVHIDRCLPFFLVYFRGIFIRKLAKCDAEELRACVKNGHRAANQIVTVKRFVFIVNIYLHYNEQIRNYMQK